MLLPLGSLFHPNILCTAENLKRRYDESDLMYSDTSHENTAQQQVLFINHGGGAVSQIRRKSYVRPQTASSPKAPFKPHLNAYPNSFGGDFGDPSLFNFAKIDIPRLFQRRTDGTNVLLQSPVPDINLPPKALSPTPSPPISHPISQPIFAHNPPNSNHFQSFFPQPELFQFFDGPFTPITQPIPSLFQRRRLTVNNVPDINQNAIGYPSYPYYKGGDENPSLTNWSKIFKFTDGRANFNEFEKQKKQGKIKFNSEERYFDHIRRDYFLILHGGTYTY